MPGKGTAPAICSAATPPALAKASPPPPATDAAFFALSRSIKPSDMVTLTSAPPPDPGLAESVETGLGAGLGRKGGISPIVAGLRAVGGEGWGAGRSSAGREEKGAGPGVLGKGLPFSEGEYERPPIESGS